MDAWQAAQNWLIFGAVVGGLAFYYYPLGKAVSKPTPPIQEVPKEIKKVARKVGQERAQTPSIVVDDASKQEDPSIASAQNGKKKRKANVQSTPQSTGSEAVHDREDTDMSTRQFAANMQKAREGVKVRSSSRNDTRLKTVKPKNATAETPVSSSGSSQVDVDEDRSPVVSPALKAGGVDDMLEPIASGPSALRITASATPAKEKTNKQPKKEVVETKKQRQNRKKVEDAKLAREAADQEYKAKGELQRRTAREARGEPAKNGIPISPAPAKNPWAEQNAARDVQLPVADNHGNSVQLLDTLDTESTGSSNQGASTAATSVAADTMPSRFTEDDHFTKAIQESELESGWNEVKTNKKAKKENSRSELNGPLTSVAGLQSAHSNAAASVRKQLGNGKPVGFQALSDEAEQSQDGDSNDPASWTA